MKYLKRMKLESRLILNSTLLIFMLMAFVLFIVEGRQSRTVIDQSKLRAIAVAQSIALLSKNFLISYNFIALQQIADNAVKEKDISYIIFLDKENKVAAFSNSPEKQNQILTDELTKSAILSSQVDARFAINKKNNGFEEKVFDVAVPIFIEGFPDRWGTLRVGLSLESTYNELSKVRFILIGIGILSAVIGWFIARVFARTITKPVEQLVDGTVKVSLGNLDYEINIEREDEVGILAKSFNKMTKEIKRSRDEIQEWNRQLEQKVLDRTKELKGLNDYLEKIISTPHIAIISTDTDDNIKIFNKGAEELTGFKSREIVNVKKVENIFVNEEDANTVKKILFQNNYVENFETTFIKKNKGTLLINLFMSQLFDDEGKKVGLIGIGVDITDKKRLENQIIQVERLRALGEMASGIAHDFNNLLGAILGRAQLLKMKAKDDYIIKGLDIIEKSALDGSETVKRIQDFTRTRTSKEFESINVSNIIKSVVDITKPRWKGEADFKGIKISIKTDLVDVPEIQGNASELSEAFTNIFFNSVDAMPYGGEITIKTKIEGENIVIEFKDTGEGMAEEVRKRIFDPFFTTKGFKGTGLGLSVTYGIIKRHNGTIDVESELGKGTTFYLKFPILKEEQEKMEKKQIKETRPMNILIIDDDENIAFLLSEILEIRNHNVTVAGSGEEGVEKFKAGNFDMVCTDLGMPKMSGWDVAKAVKEMKPGIPVALITGWGMVLDEEKIKEHKIDLVISKPFQVEKVLQEIDGVIAKINQ